MNYREALIFELKGDWGHFKKPFSSSSPLTYPFPPPTALYGVIGAVMGWTRREYLKRARELSIGVSVEVISYRKTRMGFLWLSTKQGETEYLRVGLIGKLGKDGYPKLSSGRTRVSLELLRKPHYRIGVISSNKEFLDELGFNLKRKRFYYTPYLGLTEFIAALDWQGRRELREARLTDNRLIKTYQVVPAKLVRKMETWEVLLERITVQMREDRTPVRFEDVLLPGNPSSPLKFYPDQNSLPKIGDTVRIFEDEDSQIYFFFGFHSFGG